MMTDPQHVIVSPVEKKILDSLRELPNGKLREMAEGFLVEFTGFLKDPKCPEVQADGIPCDAPSTDCEQCLKIRELVTTLRNVLPQD